MPHLADPDELQRRLRSAINGLRHWVFCADTVAGHTFLVGLAAKLLCDGAPPGELDYGCVEVCNARTLRQGALSFLTVPKGRLSRGALRRLLAAVGWKVPRPSRRQDLVCLCREAGASGLV